MEKRKYESKNRYLVSLLIATLVFLLIFAISYSISYLELQRVSNLQVGVGYDIFQDKLDYSLFNASICNDNSLNKVSKDLGFQGRIIDDLERRLGKQNENVLLRKQFYSLIELEHFEFVRDFNKNCVKPWETEERINTIFFFYSNNESYLKDSEEAGRILESVVNRNENLLVYSFDVDLSSNLVDKLERKYGVTESPTVVINEKTKLKLPANILEIEKYLF
ncbi:MAG: hypothetical protein AABX79_00745 [Nanoarchaeota archaeon]